MAKGKRRQLIGLAAKKDNDLGDIADSPNSDIKGGLYGVDDWVIVKKQKINILVPPLQVPVKKQKINILVPPLPKVSTTKGPRTHQNQTSCRKTTKTQPDVLNKICSPKSSDDRQKIPLTSVSKENIDTNERIPATAPIPVKNLNNFGTAAEGPNQVVWEPNFQPTSLELVPGRHVYGSRKSLYPGVRRALNRPTVPQSVFPKESTLFLRPIGCLNLGVLHSRRMRASNLERKLEKAGGLSTWLISLGLGQFVRLFQRRNVGKFQLLNLTMDNLKDMGANAVGPRRKLIHAIDCLSLRCTLSS